MDRTVLNVSKLDGGDCPRYCESSKRLGFSLVKDLGLFARSAMDREWGSKPGSGGAASAQNEAIDRRERLRRLAIETIDLGKDPYFMRNHLGSYECKLCLTLHNNEGNYLAHTQGKRHQTNLAKRAARDAKDQPIQPIEDNAKPRYRLMSSFEQKLEPNEKEWQYLLFAAEPYEIIAFKIPSTEIDKSANDKFFFHWDQDSKQFTLQLYFKPKPQVGPAPRPATGFPPSVPPGLPRPPPR
ncbi:splicing factor 3A subunit 2 [Selaginella moellendorffii]|uniref:splicing factor 3A subunit 2 n=1 Tax=Selaginella moellendorffii TaxID=88036 RepID=UPI000D1C39D0|nr:splicing factor 3A subunit 2 [Selaginella moellendorffii]|eukprot:XP_002994716.2 splicing factor 3A subunit 2 [Selaginella moellendorffii]